MNTPESCTSYLQLGSNLGDRQAYLDQAIEKLESNCGVIGTKSKVYESEPWGDLESQNYYLNQVVRLETFLSPLELLHATQKIESQIGRVTKGTWAARIIDIDILFFEKLIINIPELQIPHPSIAQRRFVLVPMAEVDGDYVHPMSKKNIHSMLNDCDDALSVELHG